MALRQDRQRRLHLDIHEERRPALARLLQSRPRHLPVAKGGGRHGESAGFEMLRRRYDAGEAGATGSGCGVAAGTTLTVTAESEAALRRCERRRDFRLCQE